MIRLLLEPVNLLILDEPTNHLDMASKDVLKKAIKEFEGTAIIVSHDRDFLDGLVSKVYEFGGGKVVEYLGGIYDFLTKKKLDTLQQLEMPISSNTNSSDGEAEQSQSDNKLSYEQQKELSRQKRRIEKQIEESEKSIESLESDIVSIELKLSSPEGASDLSLMKRYSETKDNLEKTVIAWEKLMLEFDKFE